MPESADAEDGDEISASCAAVAKGIEGGRSSTHQRSGILRTQIGRNHRKRGMRRDHVVGITSVERNAGDLNAGLTGKEIAATTGIAPAAVPRMPADADALPGLPTGRHVRSYGIDRPDHFMPGHAWK